jgi:hypothetical protein
LEKWQNSLPPARQPAKNAPTSGRWLKQVFCPTKGYNMDILTFFSKLIDALAWPATVICLILLLRYPLAHLLPLLSSLKYKDLELQFGSRLKQISDVNLPQEGRRQRLPLESQRANRLAELSPRAAVLESWVGIELAALNAARFLLQDEMRSKTLSYQAIRALEHSGRLAPTAVSMLHDLRALRNQAAHAPDFAISTDSAIEFADAADKLTAYFEFIGRNINPKNREVE